MKAPLNWLRDFVDIDVDVTTLCAKLVSIGFEVEEAVYLGENIENVVVGRIEKIDVHPNADKLVVCKVDVGSKTVQIVTGAANVFKGALVPVALDGAKLPTGQTIKSGELRGVKSEGMLCSGEELQITDDFYEGASADGILILDKTERVGESIVPVLGLDDYVLDIGVTANRPDCQSILGLARETAVALGKTVKTKKFIYKVDESDNVTNYVSVSVKDTDLCPTYLMTAVKNVKTEPSPRWMRRRLASVGLRGISNMVDITNYVLFEMGQPMHAFDHADVNDKQIIVRRAKEQERIVPFDEKEYILDDSVLVIADKKRAVGLAGIMGGKNSGITSDTKTVVFECAKFKRESIRRSSRKLGLRSDSSARFEKGVDTYTTYQALDRAMQLVCELKCGTIVSGRIAETVENVNPTVVTFPLSDVERLLGISVPEAEIKRILNTLGLQTKIIKDSVTVTVPAYRKDIERPCDVIEEIIRIYGYDKIENTLLKYAGVTKGGKTELQKTADKIKDVLTGKGWNEALTYSFFGKGNFDKILLSEHDSRRNTVQLLRPLGEELSTMRTILLPNMLNALSLNQNRSNQSAKLFEVAKAYLPKSLPVKELPDEPLMLSLGVYGENANFFSLKQTLVSVLGALGCKMETAPCSEPFLHPGISSEIIVNGKVLGWFGQIHPVVNKNFGLNITAYAAALNIDILATLTATEVRYTPIAKYPASERDLSLVVDESVAVGDIISCINSTSALVEDVKLFDLYRGEQIAAGKKSVSLSLKLRALDRTLNDGETESAMILIVSTLNKNFGAALR